MSTIISLLNTMSNVNYKDQHKHDLWEAFIMGHQVSKTCVPLFDTANGSVVTFPYGRNHRPVLKRSSQMERLMRTLGRSLIEEYRQSRVEHDGILYMMFKHHSNQVVPLYFGKAEICGRGNQNLSANISDLAQGHGKFGRWGYNYAYHLGDLSAATLPGHLAEKQTDKYSSWRDALFNFDNSQVILKSDIMFWATLWGPEKQSIWQDYGKTKLAFEEYLLIGVASDIFPDDLLNREGRTR